MKENMPMAILNLWKYYNDCIRWTMDFGKKSLITEILSGVIENEIKENDVFFSIIYEMENNLICMSGMNPEFVMPKTIIESREEEIQKFFDGKNNAEKKHAGCNYFRHVGAWTDEDNAIGGEIYYVLRMYGYDGIQTVFLNSLEEAYYEWTKKMVRQIANPFVKYEEMRIECGDIKDRIIKRTETIFEEKILNFYGLDLGIITEISGNYYEGNTCNSALTLKIGNSKGDGVFFAEKNYVEIKKENAKNLRKLLELCGEGHSILAERRADLKWEVRGICNNTGDVNDIIFKILDHMYWEMRVGDRFLVCYKYGKYIVRDSAKKIEEFSRNCEKVFGGKADEYLKDVFEIASKQVHGTSIIIFGDDEGTCAVNIEINRLLEESSGIALDPQMKIPREFIIGVTSIDGAVIMDKLGKCYAIGVILDGKAAIKGDQAHGARHNSVMKYIKTKKDEGLKGIGIIFSEDKTISFVTTEDDFGGHEDERKYRY